MKTLDSAAVLEHIRQRRPIIDVRAPVEFAQGTIPGAVNLPLLNDQQRHDIGICYKNQGPEAAVAMGHTLIAGSVREARLAAWSSFVEKHPDAAVMCFRGGQRSQLTQQALAKIGFNIPLIAGGFKRTRALLSELLAEKVSYTPVASPGWTVLGGLTGSGKTEVLRQAAAAGKIGFIDLEKSARHRGSAFGIWPSGQPNPIDFENDMALQAMNLDPLAQSSWIEDESRTIGRLVLPAFVFATITEAPVWILERTVEERAQRLTHEYLSENFGLRDGVAPETESWNRSLGVLRDTLKKIERRLGGAETSTMIGMLEEASITFARTGAFKEHWPWVERLLLKYYDPMYEYHLEKIKDRVVGRGPVAAWQARVEEDFSRSQD